jgi:hypothetical protein
MLPFSCLGEVSAYCYFTKLCRFGELDFSTCGGTSAVKQSGEINSFTFTETAGQNTQEISIMQSGIV